MNLFNRTITVSVRIEMEKSLIVDGVFIDSQHELVLSMTADIEGLKVIDAKGELRRAPHTDCVDTQDLTKNLIGIDLTQNVRKQVVQAISGEKGCIHFEELALECIKGIKQAQFRLMRLKMDLQEANSQIYDLLEGTCYHYRRKDPFESSHVAK